MQIKDKKESEKFGVYGNDQIYLYLIITNKIFLNYFSYAIPLRPRPVRKAVHRTQQPANTGQLNANSALLAPRRRARRRSAERRN